ncbi:hypothetical protein J1N35_017713 [Gossypium stocksii]|uniref:Uncharacterized protein n=1 Tax=Gossypium stocksii TaxID=47602 RepID=A0A9D3VML9_9ROSI|nr:hypothetical protein J1N35_017713 [Gossypium stocksii]
MADDETGPKAIDIKELQEQTALLTHNFNKAFKKQFRRFKKFDTSNNTPKTKSKGSSKLDEYFATGRSDPGKDGLGFLDKGKAIIKSPTKFVK